MSTVAAALYPEVPPSVNLGGWTVGHRHHCVHCRAMGREALYGMLGHPYAKGYDAYRHECPVCLQFWLSNDWSGDGVPERKRLRFVKVPNPAGSIVRGRNAMPIWMLPPQARRL